MPGGASEKLPLPLGTKRLRIQSSPQQRRVSRPLPQAPPPRGEVPGRFLRCPAGARSDSPRLPGAAPAGADWPPANLRWRPSGTGSERSAAFTPQKAPTGTVRSKLPCQAHISAAGRPRFLPRRETCFGARFQRLRHGLSRIFHPQIEMATPRRVRARGLQLCPRGSCRPGLLTRRRRREIPAYLWL